MENLKMKLNKIIIPFIVVLKDENSEINLSKQI